MNREKVFFVILMILTTLSLFYNLMLNPRPWHDEGSALLVAKTLAEDGVYAAKNSDGYQTFGAVQSVGPTVLLPVALSFKLFGAGLVQGRIVAGLWALVALSTFYALGKKLFGWQVALLSVPILLGSPAARFLFWGRQVLGEVPALSFFLSGWLVWIQHERTRRGWASFVAGGLIGLAMVTKNSYVPFGFVTIALLVLMDLMIYRQKRVTALIRMGLTALACIIIWTGWQWVYFGTDTFFENAAKLRTLAASVTGFHLPTTVAALKFLVGADSGHFYYWWGFPALAYAGLLCLKKDQRALTLAALLAFSMLWLIYYLCWSVPWESYLFVPATTSALFVGKLWYDLLSSLHASPGRFLSVSQLNTFVRAPVKWATAAVLALTVLHPLQATVRLDVLDQDRTPYQVADFLDREVAPDSLVETWERELALFTNHRYHFPDQSLLARAHLAVYRNGPHDYVLGADYFQKHRPSYLVIGWFSRWTGIYNTRFIAEHGELIATIGDYEIYKLHLP